MKAFFLLLLILIVYLVTLSSSCSNQSNKADEVLSIESVHPTPDDKQLFLKYKKLFEDQMYDSNSCYIQKGAIMANPNDTNKMYRQVLEYKVDNIFINDTKDSIAVLVAFRHAWILEDGSLEDEITECFLMKAIFKKEDKLEFICYPNNVGIYADGNQIEELLTKFKNLMINGGGYYINGKRNERFLYQLFNEPDAVLGNI